MAFFIEDKEIYLRPLIPADAPSMFALNNHPDQIKFTGDSPFKSEREARTFLLNYDAYSKYGFGRWAVIRKSDECFLGWNGLRRGEDGQVDIGFRFLKAFWGKSYAFNSSMLVLEVAEKEFNLDRVIARTHRDNNKSQRLLERLDFYFVKEINFLENNDGLLYHYDF